MPWVTRILVCVHNSQRQIKLYTCQFLKYGTFYHILQMYNVKSKFILCILKKKLLMHRPAILKSHHD